MRVDEEEVQENDKNGVPMGEHELTKKMRRSRKSRSGSASATNTKLNQMIRKARGSIDSEQIQPVNIEVVKTEQIEQMSLDITPTVIPPPDFQPPEIKPTEAAKVQQKRPSAAEMAILIKSP